jgi:hypothetical protein
VAYSPIVIDERRADLFGRLRRAPSPSTVPGTLPVLFFGDLFGAEVASVGLNPSDQEYLTKTGQMLAGREQRFATLDSLGASDRATLLDAQCDEAVEWMRAYYDEGKPVYGSWFNALSRVVVGFGAGFRERSAVHLDLVQESTSPVWGELPAGEREALLVQDLPFLEWEIRAFPLRAVICTGKTVSVHLRRLFGVQVVEEGAMARIKWWVGRADVGGREVGFAGWNYPLARPTGLGAAGESELGALLAEKLEASPRRHPPAEPVPLTVRPASGLPSLSAVAATAVEPPSSTAGVRGSRLAGLTHGAWDGVTLPTLRHWLRWWQTDEAIGRVENGWGREEQIARINAEIEAREAGSRSNRSTPRATAASARKPAEPASLDERSADRSGADRSQAGLRRRLYRESATRADLLSIVEQRSEEVREYLEWAKANDNEKWTFRMHARPDLARAAQSAALFGDQWWGVVVYSCFDSTTGAAAVAADFQRPMPPPDAEAALETIRFPRGSVGGHRIQPTVKGAKQALVAACADHELLNNLLHCGEDFDTRYLRLRAAKLRQWGRTTAFDLLLRAGALNVGGQSYKPDYAYLGGSTGPKSGFTRVFAESLTTDERVAWAESLLWRWAEDWQLVADQVGVDWRGPPLEPCDHENFLCIYQEHR